MKKIHSSQVKLGMKIVKIDKSWLSTPFIRHRFVISTDKQLSELKRASLNLYIADEKKDVNILGLKKHSPEQSGTKLIERSFKLLSIVLNENRASSYLNSYKIKLVVNSLVIQVLKDDKTHVYLDNIHFNSSGIAKKSLRVLIIYLTFCKYLGINKDKLKIIGYAALLHDIGMLYLPIDINNQKRLNTSEKEAIKSHTVLAVQHIKSNTKFSDFVCKIIGSHHENYNGSGYPNGLKGRQINLYSRMLSLTCAYEAMTRLRGYRPQLKPIDALSEILKSSGIMFDPRLVARFIEMMGIYPVGTKLQIINGEKVEVLKRTHENHYFVRPCKSNTEDAYILKSNSSIEVINE